MHYNSNTEGHMKDIALKLKLDQDKPFIIVNDKGVIKHINPLFEQTYGWRAEDLINQTLLSIIPTGLHDAHNLGFSRFITTGAPTLLGKELNLQITNKQGEVSQAIHVIKALKEEKTWILGANIFPAKDDAQ